VRIQLGDLKGAVAAFESALVAVETLPIRTYVTAAALDLGRAYLASGDYARGEAALTRAKALADATGNPYLSGEADRLMGDLATRRGREADARAFYDRAIAAGRRLGTSALLREALVQKARLLLNRGDAAGADTLLAEALRIVEEVRGEQAGDAIRVGFLSDKKDIALLRAQTLHALGHDSDAFVVAEESRARALLDLLSGTLPEPSQNIDSTLHEKETRLAARLGTLQEDIARQVAQETWDEARLDSLEHLRLATARAFREVTEEIAVRDPVYAALASARPPLSVAEIRSRVLSPGQVLLEYLVGDSTTMLFLLRRDALRAYSLSFGERDLAPEVAAFRAAIGAGSDDAKVLARTLYSRLVEPAAADLPENARLLVVPDGSLFQLPFAALRDNAHFLVERHAFAYTPSASVLDPLLDTRNKQNKRTKKSMFLAVGNPSSYRSRELLAEARDGTRWRFGELPYAEEEARRIAALFPSSTLLLGSYATEEEVKRVIGGASQVHFATHAIASEEEPLLSGLVLAEDEDPAEDGFLQVHEILKLRMHADLVALSACNTGLGDFAGGEGVLGLTRSFLYAGASAVLISLWEVADRSTLEIMDTFYHRAIATDRVFDESLRDAQLDLLKEGASIREWAPFAIVGHARPNAPSGRRAPIVLAFFFATLVAIVGWILSKRRTTAPEHSVQDS
jgi:CHAT domain-containing protein